MAKTTKITTSFTPYPAPNFTAPSSAGDEVSKASLIGRWSVLFFYPTDDTPTCTQESCDFSAALPEFQKLGVALYGISKDNLKDHDKFVRKYGLKMPLLSDETLAMITAFGSWVEKSLYGRAYMGTDRSTFIIDPQGLVRHVWRKVKVKNHVDQVLTELTTLMTAPVQD